MVANGGVEILLVDDNQDDLELTLSTFEDFNMITKPVVCEQFAGAA